MVDANVETFEPSGSNDALFFRTMADVEQRVQRRARIYRRRLVAAIVMTCGIAAFMVIATLIVLDSVF